MSPTRESAGCRASLRRSVLSLCVVVPLTLVLCLGLWGLTRWLAFAWGAMLVVLAVAAFTIVGDTVNIIFQRRRLREMQRKP